MWNTRLLRLFSILGQLSPHSQTTVMDLVREYEVSERTIERDIETLSLVGVTYNEGKITISRQGCKSISEWMLSTNMLSSTGG
ncbi:HTH domain-containing protein [Candidatus Uabimicrobium sp. HlEnr_7]|uniref:HTH domain-containing protein n=1 Tax=Candidatus Uabimicrobium helgolandensis TaxID=3095367 RepID=UPI003558A99D